MSACEIVIFFIKRICMSLGSIEVFVNFLVMTFSQFLVHSARFPLADELSYFFKVAFFCEPILSGILEFKCITLPNFPLFMQVYKLKKKYNKSVFSKIILCEMMMSITQSVEVHKFSP